MNKKKKTFSRFTALIIIMIFVFTGIISKLVYMQVVKAEEYSEMANKRSVTELEDFAPRGEVLDKNGTKLATNVQSYILTYTETDDSKNKFYDTMNQVFKILDDNKETQNDDFELKINPFRFEFKAQTDEDRKELELRFKKDRGLDEKVMKDLNIKKKDNLSDEEKTQIDDALLKITPEETFKYLVNESYDITPNGEFKTIVAQYKDSPRNTISELENKYKIENEQELTELLETYKKKSIKANMDALIQKYSIDKLSFSIEQQRRYMLVKDKMKMQSFSGYKPVTMATNIKKETAFIFYQKLNDLPGIDITIQPMRYYPYDELGSAFLGYISKIGSDSDRKKEQGYDVNQDYIGTAGIEKAFEDRLKGSKGGRIVKLNRQGRIYEELGRRDSYPGQTIQLTIDKDVQYAAEVALDNAMANLQKAGLQKDVNTVNATRGAAVAIDVNTGAIIAMASRPGFDPNDFANGLSTANFNKYFNTDYESYAMSKPYLRDKDLNKIFPLSKDGKTRRDENDIVPKPLYNYATLSRIPPGSTFKPLTAIAALEAGVITPTSPVYPDRGQYTNDDIYPTIIRFPDDGPLGDVNLTSALAKSSNPYFMNAANLLRKQGGDNSLAQYAWKFGLGIDPKSKTIPSTGIEIPESFGQVYNTWSIRNSFATQFWYNIRDNMKSGKGSHQNINFNSIDLNKEDGDSEEVKGIKDDIKLTVQDAIMSTVKEGNGGQYTNKLTDLFKKLVNADYTLKDKKFSDSTIKVIAQDIMLYISFDVNTEITTPVNILNAAIGQGIDNFTPLQLANYVATIANGGTRYKVHLVDKIMDADGNIVQQNDPEIVEKTGVKQSTIDAVKAGMLAVNGGEGTAAGYFNGFPIETAGKTGSATAIYKQEDYGRTSYAVYVGFAPYQNPRIAVAIVIFDGGHGGFIAPVARAIYEAYFKKELDALGYVPQNDVVAKPEK